LKINFIKLHYSIILAALWHLSDAQSMATHDDRFAFAGPSSL